MGIVLRKVLRTDIARPFGYIRQIGQEALTIRSSEAKAPSLEFSRESTCQK